LPILFIETSTNGYGGNLSTVGATHPQSLKFPRIRGFSTKICPTFAMRWKMVLIKSHAKTLPGLGSNPVPPAPVYGVTYWRSRILAWTSLLLNRRQNLF